MATLVLGGLGQAAFGPVGGFVGGVIGSFIDRALFQPDLPVQEGPRLGDLSAQAHAPGSPITIPYGQTCPCSGTLVWTSNIIETRHEEEVEGGKGLGGPESTVVTYTYSINLAIMVCEGPIDSITRIWANNKLLYNAGSFSRATDIRVALGTQTQEPDSMLEAAEGAGSVPAFRGRVMVYIQGLQLADFGNVTPQFKFEVKRGSTADTIQYVIGDLCQRVGLTAGTDFDVSYLPLSAVRGFPLANITTPRAAFEALQKAFPFDVADTGYRLVFRDRNRLADATIRDDDLAAHSLDDTPGPKEPTTRAQDRELPRLVTIKYMDPDRDFDINAAESARLVTDSKHEQIFEIPLVLSAAEAKRATDDLAIEFWLQRLTKRVTLPVKYLALDAGDVVHLLRTGNALTQRFRVRRLALQANGIVEAEMHPHLFRWARNASPGDSADAHILAQQVPIVSNTIMQLLDVPLLSDKVPDTNGFYAAGYDEGNQNKWDGWWLYRALDGATYERVQRFDVGVTAGSCVTALADGPTDYPDRKNTVRVNFANGTPASITDDALQRAGNPVICGASSRWEVMQFRDAALVSGTVYDLSHLIRGRAGTEHNTGNHAAGDKFYVLSESTTKRVEQELSLLNAAVTYKPVTFFQAVASATAETFTNAGESLKPWSGVNGSAVRVGNDWTISWTRRNRQFGGWNNGGDVPMTEASEKYEGDVKAAAGSVVRTVTVSTPAITYTSAQQVADFGGVQASVTLDVYQISQRIGRGHGLTITGQT